MGKITIQEIATKLTLQNGLSKKEATLFANMMFDLIREAVERDKSVKVKGLGTFKIIDVDSRESVNVNTGERVLIEGHNKITFTPDVLMKELVNKPFSQFETIVLNEGVDFKDTEKEEKVKSDAEDIVDADEVDGEGVEMPLVDFVSDEMEKPAEPESLVEEKPALEFESVVKPELTMVSEPAMELEPTIVPEPVIEPEPKMVPESTIEPEPAIVPEPTIEPESQVEPESLVDPEALSEEEQDDEESGEIEDEEDEPTSKRWQLWLLACVLSLGIGYMLGNYFPFRGQTENLKTEVPPVEKAISEKPAVKPAQPVAEPVKDETETKEVPEAVKTEEKVNPKAQEQPAAPAQSVADKQPEVKAPAEVKAPEVNSDKYEAMDPRVRTGAYRIVGTDHVEKVKEGDNLQRICKRTIGPGMECYIEVYNNINANTELKKGMEIKIPKLVWKKKKTAQK